MYCLLSVSHLQLVFPGGARGKEPTCQCRRHWVQLLGQEDPLEEGMATHSRGVGFSHRGAWWAVGHRVAKSWTQLSNLACTLTYNCVWQPVVSQLMVLGEHKNLCFLHSA